MNDIKKIGKMRKQLGITQKQLADLAGVSQSLIAKIESEKIDPAYSKVTQIMQALEAYQKKEKTIVSQVMTEKIYSVSQKDPVTLAIDIMKEEGISQMPVLEGGKCIGSISESSIIDLVSKGRNLKQIKVGEVMRESFPAIPSNSVIDVAADLLKHYPALLVEQNGKLAGIITKADLLKAI
ncbi:CBS domain-containing protein [Candidatus Micrarchaeota archaeon]|nr:CBS domain-containing protein [Candidatus Micrarchaeota archaeon]